MENTKKEVNLDLMILDVLKKNGFITEESSNPDEFSTEFLGTHYYKEVIKRVIYHLISGNKDKQELLEDALNPFSFLYFDIALQVYKIDYVDHIKLVKAFHHLIKKASFMPIAKGKEKAKNRYLMMSYYFGEFIFNSLTEEEKQTIKIQANLDNDAKYFKCVTEEEPKVRILSNQSDE